MTLFQAFELGVFVGCLSCWLYLRHLLKRGGWADQLIQKLAEEGRNEV